MENIFISCALTQNPQLFQPHSPTFRPIFTNEKNPSPSAAARLPRRLRPFRPATVLDNATANNPTALYSGITAVWVNGQLVFENGKATERRAVVRR